MQKTTVEVQIESHTVQGEQQKDITTTAGSAALAGLGDISNGVLRYVTNVAMTHMVIPTVYGIFNEVYTVMIILGWIAKLGFDGVLLCLLPAYRMREDHAFTRGLTRFAFCLTLISGLCISGLIFVCAFVIARLFYHDPSYRLPLQELALLIPLFALQLIISAWLQACKKIKWKVYVDRLSQPVLSLISLCAFYLAGWRMEALSFSTLSGYLCSVCIGSLVIRRVLKQSVVPVAPGYTPRIWLMYAFPLLFNGLIYGIVNSADVLFLSVFATPAQAAIYIAAERVSGFVATPLVALNMIFSPLIAEYHTSGRQEQLATMFKLVNKWSLSLSLPIFLGTLIFREPILSIFGPEYTAGGLALIILCTGNMVNAGTGSVLQILVMTGRLRIISINSIVTIFLNISLSFLLVPRFNILGAALAAALAVIILNIISLSEVYWIMRLHPYRWDACKALLAGGIACLVALLLLRVTPTDRRFLTNVIRLSLLFPFLLTYGLTMIALRFSQEDWIVLHAISARFGRGKWKKHPKSLKEDTAWR